jgi:hypothetical protein
MILAGRHISQAGTAGMLLLFLPGQNNVPLDIKDKKHWTDCLLVLNMCQLGRVYI